MLGNEPDSVGAPAPLIDVSEQPPHFSTSFGLLEERLGAYEIAAAVVERDAREQQRREAGIAERVERLCDEPGLVLDRLAEIRSLWNGADAEREVRSMLAVPDGYAAAVGDNRGVAAT